MKSIDTLPKDRSRFLRKLVSVSNISFAGEYWARISKHIYLRRDPSLANALDTIFEQERSLSDASREFERGFINVLDSLEKLEDISNNLSAEAKALVSMSNSEDHPVLRISRVLDQPLEFIEESASNLVSLVDELAANEKSIRVAQSFEMNLEKTLSQLTYLRTLFAVEAASLGQDDKSMFTALVEEISRLQKDVVSIFKEKFHELDLHRATIDHLKSRLSTQGAELLSAAEMKKRELQEELRAQESNLEQVISANHGQNKSCETISQMIGQSIIALQSQDIVNQKIQHIFEISKEMRMRMNSADEDRTKRGRCKNYRFIENASMVIINQIHAVKKEINQTEATLKSNFQHIGSTLSEIDRSNDPFNKAMLGSKNESAARSGLINALNDTSILVQQTEEIASEAFAQIEPIRGMASNVTEIILGLSAQLHLIGLNAEVHAAQMDGCHGLEILSSNTSRISIETRVLCQQVSEKLDVLVDNLNANVEAFESLHRKALSNRTQINSIAPEEKEIIHKHDTAYEKSESNLSHLTRKLNDIFTIANSNLNLGDSIISSLDNIADCLEDLSRTAGEEANRLNIDVDIPQLMDTLLSSYTMQSEKNIHLQSLGLDPILASPQPQAIADQFPEFDRSTFTEEHIDFIWDDTSSDEPVRISSSKSSTDDFGDNAELF